MEYENSNSGGESVKSGAAQSGTQNPQGSPVPSLPGSPVGAPNSYRSVPPGCDKRGPVGMSHSAAHDAPNQRKD